MMTMNDGDDDDVRTLMMSERRDVGQKDVMDAT